jgi:ABC-type Fe3+/spermidine/putrescine transport system ATPase subunit
VGYLEIKNLTKKFGDFTAVEDINLTVEKGEMVALLGASGCGKTTILRMIAGFLEPNSGTITINGKVVNRTPPHKRKRGILFPELRPVPAHDRFQQRGLQPEAEEAWQKGNPAKGCGNSEASRVGGKGRQVPQAALRRTTAAVALARALVMEPEVLLLDEPLSNLDAKLRHDMQGEIKRIQKELGLTTIIVTHDQEEAVSLANRVVIMNAGHILQKGEPTEVFNHPSERFVADFMGFSNFIEGTVAEVSGGELQVDVGGGYLLSLANAGVPQPCCKGDRIEMTIRPEKVLISRTKQEGYHKGTILNSTYKGLDTLLRYPNRLWSRNSRKYNGE